MGIQPRFDRPTLEHGFTLLELLIAIAVAAILLTIAVPSYRSIVQANSIAANVNDLVGDLNYARSEAVTRGQSVFLCASSDQTRCSGAKDWSSGWVVFAPKPGNTTANNNNLLRVHGPLDSQLKLDSKDLSRVFFDANGFATGSAGTLTASTESAPRKTEVVIATTGRVRSEQYSEDSS